MFIRAANHECTVTCTEELLKHAKADELCGTLQGAESQMQQVLDRKLADKDVINQGDATQIARAEAKLTDGQTPPNSISSKAQVQDLSTIHVAVTTLIDYHRHMIWGMGVLKYINK